MKRPVIVCMGRFGDVYQAAKACPVPAIVFTSQTFAPIIRQLCPQHEVMVYTGKETGIGRSMSIAAARFPGHEIMPAQQHPMPMEVRAEFRNYQVYQEWQAGKREYSYERRAFDLSTISRAVVHFGGISSPVTGMERVKRNVFQGLRAAGLDVVEYEQADDFIRAHAEFNDPNTLYVVNDSVEYHMCDTAPVIIMSRSIQWAQSSPKQNCIGRLTHEQLYLDYSELLAIIHRGTSMRPLADHFPAKNYLVFSEYTPRDSDTFKRHGWAQISWAKAIETDYHVELAPFSDEGLPMVNEMLAKSLELSQHPDDLIILLNRDICLVPEAVGMLRAFMDSRDIDACYLHHVNVRFDKPLTYTDIMNMPHDWGVDAFVFRPSAKVIQELVEVPLYLGRTDWDNYWASVVKVRCPYNLIYHYPHTGEWKGSDPQVMAQNEQNQANIMAKVEPMIYDQVGFRGLGPIS